MRKSFEDLSGYSLSREDEERLLRTQSECTFIWSRKDGWPVGVTMTYIYRDGRIWMTTSGQHPRVLAVKRDERCCVVVSSAGAGEIPMVAGSVPTMRKGKATTIKGRCKVLSDAQTKAWFFREFAAAAFPHDRAKQDGFVKMMDSPRRAIMCIEPEGEHITWDNDKMLTATGGAVGMES
jgi:general stress protein 26